MSLNFFVGAATVCLSAMGYSYISVRSPPPAPSAVVAVRDESPISMKTSSQSKQQQPQQQKFTILPIAEPKGSTEAEFKKGEENYNIGSS